MDVSEKINRLKMTFRSRRMKRFEYDSSFYMTWLAISLGIWLCFLALDIVAGEWFRSVERLFWWFWLLLSMFVWQRRESNLVFKHNMQVIDANFRELQDARINAAVIGELIDYKQKEQVKKKCCGSCKTKKATKSSTKKKTS